MSTPLRFSDNEYKNWLKSGLALIHCKDSLHDLVDNEVKKLHADIQQQIVTIHGRHCNSCTWKSIKYRQGRWCISCNNNICDRWLSQILLEHNDQYNHSINWKNADISKWPTDAYEVAKVYMPKGQDQTKNLPQGFDVSAILSLFKYCTWFTKKIPNTAHLVSDLIDIRNELFHSKDFRVADNKKDICINNTIQLLSELCINGNVVSELWKLRLEDIDINYRETEVKVFNTILSAVKDEMDSLLADQIQLSGDLNTAQTTVTSLQAMQTQQGQGMQEIKDQTTHTSGIVDTMATDIKEIKSELEQEREIFVKVKSFLLNNPDIQDKNISENIYKIESIVNDLQCKLDKAVKDIPELKRRMSSIENRQEVQEKRQDVHEKRQEMLEKFFAEMAEKDGKKQSGLQNDVESLRAELLSRYKSLSTIPISVFDEDEKCQLENLYTCTDIVINCKDKERNSRENDQTSVPYKHLFKGRQRIILTGPSGSGKSTFLRKIVNRWCDLKKVKKTDGYAEGTGTNKTSVSDSSCTISDEDLDNSDLLFYINSPEISNERTLIEVLCNQCLKRERVGDQDEIQQKVAKILIDLPEKILMIFDGLNELGHIPNFLVELTKRALYPEITVLMATRPWHISSLGLKATGHYDLLLDIQGFSTDNARKFVKKVFDVNNSMRASGQTKDVNISSEAEAIMLSFKNVPLLLLFHAHILYRDQSLPHKRKDLYDIKIDALIKRCLKKTGSKHVESNLDQENICSKLFREKYLNSACEVACHFLLTRKDGVSVVIPQKELIQQLGVDADRKLSALLDSGIMSKSDSFSVMEKNVSVTFLHPSLQEYLASIHLVKINDAFQSFLQSVKTLNDVLRHENHFIFVCGLDAGQGHRAFTRICEVCDSDPYVKKYRQGEDDDDGYSYFRVKGDIENLNKMYKACIGEMDTEEPLQIPDIIAQNDEWFRLVMSRQSLHHVRSLTLPMCDVIHSVHDLSSLCYLTSLTLWHLELSEEQCRSLCISISSFTQLQKLELLSIILPNGVIDLSNLHDLTFLKLALNKDNTFRFINFSACEKLEKLELHGTTLSEGILDFKKLTGLTHLTLASLRKSRECTLSLCNSLRACTKLKKLELNGTALFDGTLDSNALTDLTFLTLSYVSVSDGSSRSLCSNISHITCLKRLDLSKIDLHDGILDLNTLTQLTHLTLVSVTMSKRCSYCLCNCLRSGNIAHMKRLDMDDIKLNDGVLDLTKLTSLTHLVLKTLTMSDKCAKSLCNSLSACTELEKLDLYDINLHGGVLDLKTLTSLTELTLSMLKKSEECTKSLSNSISVCTNLKLLWLEDISLHDTVHDDLKKLRNLSIQFTSGVKYIK